MYFSIIYNDIIGGVAYDNYDDFQHGKIDISTHFHFATFGII
jgi:hypothetical protein